MSIAFSVLESDNIPRGSLISTPEMPEIVSLPSRFEKKQESGHIDVWWLYDDGGTHSRNVHFMHALCYLQFTCILLHMHAVKLILHIRMDCFCY